MNNSEMQILIDRYLNGVTTPEEEKLLARALLCDDIPDEWKVVRIMLGELAMSEAEYDADMAKDASRKKSFVLPVPVRWLVAASVALLLGFVCFNYMGQEEKTMAEVKAGTAVEQKSTKHTCRNDSAIKQRMTSGQKSDDKKLLADNMEQNTDKSQSEPIQDYMGQEEKTMAEVKAGTAVEQKSTKHTCKNDSAIKQRTTSGQKSDDKKLLADNMEQNTDKSQSEPIQDVTLYIPDSEPMDKNLHYASMAVNDTPNNYQAPSRMEEFIIKIADYNRVKAESLACASNHDSLTVCTAYVFEDTQRLNLFSRLLQAACWYEDTTPGYLLNYSHQQFFFQLKDLRLGMQYLWIAERIRGKILMYCTHSPLDADVSSDCFREYRDKLSNTTINPNPKKL